MNKGVSIATFVAGLAVGVLVTRCMSSGNDRAGADGRPPIAAGQRPQSHESTPPIAQTEASPPSASAPSPVAPANLPPELLPPRGPPAAAMPGARYVPTPPLPPDDGSIPANPIDVGDVFRAEISRPSTAEHPNPLGDAHRALERETRDDVWANAMEQEIQNSLLMETSVGNFRTEHVECRATLCELRLSSKGEPQTTALGAWGDNVLRQPWAPKLLLQYSSSIGRDGNSDRIVILRRPK
jgi:hypothetical protein